MLYNHKLVLSLISMKDSLTINEISENINLSKTTVKKIINNLCDKKIIIDYGKGLSTGVGGKKPSLFKFNDRFKFGISILSLPNIIIGSIHDLKGSIICRIDKEGDFDNYQSSLESICQIIFQLIEQMQFEPAQICGIALACEGVIDSKNGIVRYPIQHKHWGVNLNIKIDLSDRLPFDTKIIVENVCCYAGFKELMNPRFYSKDSIVTINTIESTGGCVIRNNSLIKGNNGYVGEVGHLVVDYNSDVICSCGGKGCFEALVSPMSVVGRLKENQNDYQSSTLYQKHDVLLSDIFKAADDGDQLARLILDKVILYFAILIHDISLLQDPDAIIIQGAYSESGQYFKNQLLESINLFPFYKLEHDIDIYFSEDIGLDAFLVGASFYLYHQYFNDDDFYL